MGAAVSRSSVTSLQKTLNESLSSALIATNQTCSNGQLARNNVDIGTIKDSKDIDITANAEQAANVVCLATADSSVDFKSALTASTKATVKSEATASLAVGFAQSDAYVNSKQEQINRVVNSVDIQTLQSCLSDQFIEQGVRIQQILNSERVSITVSSSQQSAIDCVLKQQAVVSAVNSLAADMSADLSAKSSAGLSAALLLMIIIIIVIVIAIVAVGPAVVVRAIFGAFNAAIKGVFGSVGATAAGITSLVSTKGEKGKPAAPPAYSA